MVSSFDVLRLKVYMHFAYPPCMSHALAYAELNYIINTVLGSAKI
jgi:hypothetical protein